MDKTDTQKIQLLSDEELALRLNRLRIAMSASGIDEALICDNANIYYLTGRVFSGFVLVPTEGELLYAVKRPCHLEGNNVMSIRKIEEIAGAVSFKGGIIGLEMNRLPYNTIRRIQKAFGTKFKYADVSAAISEARSLKTPHEIELIKFSGIRQAEVYRRIPHLYQDGMRDIDLQIEIERAARLAGCLGQFRISGNDMELFMGNVLVGDNADSPSPYDFAMGGAGMSPSLPVGADGTLIRRGQSVMVDMNGNFTGYMTDMTRCFSLDSRLSQRALDAHKLSIDICDCLRDMGQPGVEAKDMYNAAVEMARQAGFENEFMGHRQHAGFVGHGVGIEINEQPVIAPRSKSILQVGNVIALEPKFVIPGVGAVGIENTYAVSDKSSMECLTIAPQQIVYFE